MSKGRRKSFRIEQEKGMHSFWSVLLPFTSAISCSCDIGLVSGCIKYRLILAFIPEEAKPTAYKPEWNELLTGFGTSLTQIPPGRRDWVSGLPLLCSNMSDARMKGVGRTNERWEQKQQNIKDCAALLWTLPIFLDFQGKSTTNIPSHAYCCEFKPPNSQLLSNLILIPITPQPQS
jgi:hypothetical protein